MRKNTKGIWTCIKYRNEIADPNLADDDVAKKRPTIYLWARDLDRKRIRIPLKGFKPYFFCPMWIRGDSHYIFEMPEIEKYEEVKFGPKQQWSLYRIFTYIPGHVVKVKKAIQSRFAQAAVLEGDVLFELRYLIDQGLRGEIDWYDLSNPIAIQEDLNIPLRRIYLDTEIWSTRTIVEGKIHKKEYIKCITAYDNYEKIYFTWYFNESDLNIPSTDIWKIIYCDSIKKMMIQFFEYVRDRDPDVITGYNIDFDLLAIRAQSFMENVTKEYDYLSALWDLGYSVDRPILKKHRIRGVDWSRRGLNLDGREVIDILDCIRMISRSQLREYSLDYVSKQFIDKNEGKIRYEGKPIAPQLPLVWKKDPMAVLKYNMHDCELCVKLDEKNDLIDFLDGMRKTVGVRLNDAFSNQRMIDTEALRRRKYPLPSKFTHKSAEKDSYKGAFVITPILGLHSWVIALDFKSLYPTIIRTFNMDTETYVVDTSRLRKGRPVYSFSNEDNTKTWTFVKEPRGLFPQMLDDWTILRDSIRAKLEKEKDPERKELLDTKQEVIKVLSNATYGSFGYRSRKHSMEVAEAITSFGQKMIKFAASIAEEKGFIVVYGDTDSIFVKSGKENFGDTFNEGRRLEDEINKRAENFTYQFNVDEKNLFKINFEKIYDRFFMAVKKRYCGRVIKKDGKFFLDVKGLDTKRSDTSEYAAGVQQRLLETLLEGRAKEELASDIAKELNELDKQPLLKIGVPSAISKPLNDKGYKNNAIQKRAGLNSNTYLGTNFEYGSKPVRIYIKVPPREKIFPRSGKKTDEEKKELDILLKGLNVIAFDDTTEIPDWVEIDYPKVVKLTIVPKISKFLESLDIKWDEIETLLRPELQKKKKISKTKKEKSKPSCTLDKFIGGSK